MYDLMINISRSEICTVTEQVCIRETIMYANPSTPPVCSPPLSPLSTRPRQPTLTPADSLASVGETRHLAKLAIRPAANLAGLLAAAVARVAVAVLALVLAAVGDRAGIAVVGVDAAQHAAIDSHDVVHDNVARAAVVGAVAAAAHDLAVVVDVEVLDVDGPEAVELDDLVVGVESAAADDVGGAAGLLEGAGRS